MVPLWLAVLRMPQGRWGSLRPREMMARVVLVGSAPTRLISQSRFAAGEAPKINAGIALALKEMRPEDGSRCCLIRPDETAGQTVEHPAAANYACVVIGAGVRLPQDLRCLKRSSAVHRAAPTAAIAFCRGPRTARCRCDGSRAQESTPTQRTHGSGCRSQCRVLATRPSR